MDCRQGRMRQVTELHATPANAQCMLIRLVWLPVVFLCAWGNFECEKPPEVPHLHCEVAVRVFKTDQDSRLG